MGKFDKPEIQKRVREAAEILGIHDYLHRKPRQLSGGQRQRVALGRCIVRHPQVFLFDEPLSNLDAELRAHMRIELKRLRERIPVTSIYVTHDQVEAMTLGDRVAVMRDGRLQQLGTPLEIYNRPKNRFVAGFIGAPAMNFLEVTLENSGGQLYAAAPGFRIRVPNERASLRNRSGDGAMLLGVRPEHTLLGEPKPEHGTGFDAVVEVTEQLGAELLL